MSPLEKNLTGKVAIVTGSGRGIGAAIVLKLASHGADVVVNYHSSSENAERVAEEARKGYGVRAICVRADVSSKADITNLFESAKQHYGHIDIVMSNSGIEHFGTLQETTEADIDKVFATNGVKRHAIYSASKAAVTGMVKCLAVDLGERSITVNCIAPGGIKTDMWEEYAKDYVPESENMSVTDIDERIAAMSPLKRVGLPSDVAGVVALLASEEAQWLTGQTIHVGGGAHMATA